MVWYTWTSCDCTSSSTTTSTWYGWQQPYHQGTYDTSSTWSYWMDGSTTSDAVWYTWIPQQPSNYQQPYQPQPQRQLTVEEVQRNEEKRIRLEEVARKEREEAEHQRKLIEEKALQLLLENLTENQAEIFKATGAIPVVCPSGRRYKINKGISANVEELDEKNQRRARLCFHPYDCPTYDVMLAQKLALEVCEEEARKIANFS